MILHLHLKYEYFDAILSGEKKQEYRAADKWQAKLDQNNYSIIRLYRGYQRVCSKTTIDRAYKGYILKTIRHKHFNNIPTQVCAIDVTH